MANAAIKPIRSGPPPVSDGDIPVQHTDFDARGFGRRFPQTDAPEGWVKKVNRREGKVWVGFFHLWTTDAQARRVRTKKEKTLGYGSLPKHEAQQKLADYIANTQAGSRSRLIRSRRSMNSGRPSAPLSPD